MLLFGLARSRQGLASALIGEIAAVLDCMERFEEVRKPEDMEIGAEKYFTAPRFYIAEILGLRIQMRID